MLLTALLTCTATSHGQQWTLDQCIDYAMAHNIDIRRRAVQLQKQEVMLNSSRNEWLPEVSAAFGEQFSFGNYNSTTGSMNGSVSDTNNDLAYTTGNVTATMNIFDGMKVRHKTTADRFSLEAATASLEQARRDVGIQIAIHYLQCLYHRSLAAEAKEQLQLSQQMVSRAQHLVSEGKRPLSELKDMEAQAAHDAYTLTNSQGQYTLALTKLSQLLNLPTAESFDIVDISVQDPSATPVVAYDQVVDSWPSIVAAKAHLEAGKAKVKVARAGYYPTLYIEGALRTFYVNFFHHDMGWGGFGRQFFRQNRNEVIGLHLKVPIFNAFKTRNSIRAAKIDVLNSSLALEEARQTLRQEIQTAQTNAEVARGKLASAQAAADAAAVSVSYEQERYDAGRSSVFDLLQARQKHMKARQDALQAKYELLIRQRILRFYSSL